MPEVRIYTTPFCGFCRAALRLLRDKGVEFEQIDVTGDREARSWLRETTGQRTVPQVFIDGTPHGGYSDLVALDGRGELDGLLGLSADVG